MSSYLFIFKYEEGLMIVTKITLEISIIFYCYYLFKINFANIKIEA